MAQTKPTWNLKQFNTYLGLRWLELWWLETLEWNMCFSIDRDSFRIVFVFLYVLGEKAFRYKVAGCFMRKWVRRRKWFSLNTSLFYFVNTQPLIIWQAVLREIDTSDVGSPTRFWKAAPYRCYALIVTGWPAVFQCNSKGERTCTESNLLRWSRLSTKMCCPAAIFVLLLPNRAWLSSFSVHCYLVRSGVDTTRT